VTLPLQIANPYALDLSAYFLVKQGLAPLVAGDDWTLRLQVRDAAGAAVSLTGALILMHVRETLEAAGTLFTRRSDTNIPSTSIKQIEADANQVTEDPIAHTGKGWFTIRCSDEDETALRAAKGNRFYDVRVKLGDGTVRTIVKGMIEILDPSTRPTT
jgi:hypothetical protein